METTGEDLDPDDYRVVLDDVDSLEVEVTGSVIFSGVEEGDHEVELADVASNCEVAGQNPRTVTVVAGDTVEAGFDVACRFTLRNKIVFASDRGGTGLGLFVMDGDGSSPRPLLPAMVDFYPAVSADGERVAFTRAAPTGFEIFVADADGSDVQPLTDIEAVLPSWSPDGTQIAFAQIIGGGDTEKCVMNADGSGTPVCLTEDPAEDLVPNWSPDGSMVAFPSDRDGDLDLWGIRLDGTGLINFTSHPDIDITPSWGR